MTSAVRRRPGPGSRRDAESTAAVTGVARHAGWLVLLAIVGASIAVSVAQWPVLSATASTLDDPQYWRDNPLVQNPSWASVRRICREVLKPSIVEGYYQPLTMVSLMLDRAMGTRADDLRPIHRTNLALHVVMTALILVLLYQLFGNVWVAALVALLFGVHPMAIEPMAWLTERKTLLAAVFSVGSMVLYVRYVHRQSWGVYGAALAAFVLALLSKPTSTPLPVMLLLLDFWPLRRLSPRTIVEKVPFFIIAGVSAIITVVSQARAAGIQLPHEQTQFRFALTLCHNLVFYLWTMIWPVNLTLWHPYPEPFDLSQPAVLAGVIGTLILIPVLLISLRWTRALCVGGLFFLVAIFPTLGAIGFTYMMASQKYAYLPVVGLLLILAAGLKYCWERGAAPLATRWRAGVLVGLLVAAVLAGWRTRVELGYWQTTERLYRHMLTLAPQTVELQSVLAADLAQQGRVAEALELFKAASAWPSSRGAVSLHINWGLTLRGQGQFDDALTHFGVAVENDPNTAQAHLLFGNALLTKQRWAEAETHLKDALRLYPEYTEAYLDLGVALAKQQKYSEAQTYLENALQADPRSVEALSNLALVLVKLDRVEQGIARYREALRLSPERFEVHVNLADALRRQGQLDDAAAEYRSAINLRPDFAYCYDQLGQILTSEGRLDEALETYESGVRNAPENADLRARLGAARAGRPPVDEHTGASPEQ